MKTMLTKKDLLTLTLIALISLGFCLLLNHWSIEEEREIEAYQDY